MKRIIACVLVVYALGIFLPADSGQFYGGKGYLHTNSALLLPPGALDLSLYARGYTTKVNVVSTEWSMLSNGTSALAASFGFSRSIELGFSQILYQDLNATFKKGEEATLLIPGDTFIRFKIGGWPIGESVFMSLLPAIRYRVGKFHDIHLEPYESEAVEIELITIVSYFWKPLYPDEDKSLHFNFGYVNHNDAEAIGQSSQQINYLVGFMYPMRIFDYGIEVYGTHFVVEPPENILGREDWLYACPMLKYKPFKGFQFTLGLDMLVIGYKNTSKPDYLNRKIDPNYSYNSVYPNYSKWRISGRINFSPSTSFYISPTFVKSEEAGTGRAARGMEARGGRSGDFLNKDQLFRWAIEDQVGGVDAVNLDLVKLRQERMKAEAELKSLKKRLEDKKRGSSKK